MKLWLIDAGYLFYGQNSIQQGFRFDYKKLLNKLEEFGKIEKGSFFRACRTSINPLKLTSISGCAYLRHSDQVWG